MPHFLEPAVDISPNALRRRQLIAGTMLLACTPPILAQNRLESAAPEPATDFPRLQGQTVDGQRLALVELRGQVVLVFHWSTGCAVCRDKMHEMRANVAGWAGRPFQLLGVNWDARRNDLLDYESLLRQTVPREQRLQSIWTGDEHYVSSMARPNHLPMASLIDKQGRLVDTYNGRIPPEAWDHIASLI
jgi:cytochrome oxidase Cu insertion factor (SCO1/SenC/PrrC family)